jgi:ankyrin repeat protein
LRYFDIFSTIEDNKSKDIDLSVFNLLVEAARWGHLEVVKFLHSQGADLSIRDNGGCLPIHYAAFNGNLNSSQKLQWLQHLT